MKKHFYFDPTTNEYVHKKTGQRFSSMEIQYWKAQPDSEFDFWVRHNGKTRMEVYFEAMSKL